LLSVGLATGLETGLETGTPPQVRDVRPTESGRHLLWVRDGEVERSGGSLQNREASQDLAAGSEQLIRLAVGKEIDAIRSVWKATARQSIERLAEFEKYLGTAASITLVSIQVEDPIFDGDAAWVPIRFELKAVDGSGSPLSTFGRAFRAVVWEKRDDGWVLADFLPVSSHLMDLLLRADGEDGIQALLNRDGKWVPDDLATRLLGRGQTLENAGDLGAAVHAYEAARRVGVLKADRNPQIRSLHAKGRVQLNSESFADAYRTYSTAVELARLDGGHWLAVLLLNLTTATRLEGRLWESLDAAREAVTIAEELGRPEVLSSALSTSGAVHMEMGLNALALEQLGRALPLVTQLGNQQHLAELYQTLGNTYENIGDYTLAALQYHQVKAIFEKEEDRLGVAATIVNLANVALEQGDAVAAARGYAQALAVLRDLGHTQGTAAVLMNMAVALRLQGKADEALDAILEARRVQSGRPNPAADFHEGAILRQMGRHRDAIEVVRRAQQEFQERGQQREVASARLLIAHAYFSLGEDREALEESQASLRSLLLVGDRTRASHARKLIGDLHAKQGRLDLAEEAYEGAIQEVEQIRSVVAGPELARQIFLETRLGAYHALMAVRLEQGRAWAALKVGEQARSRVLLDLLAPEVARGSGLTEEERSERDRLNTLLASANAQARHAARAANVDERVGSAREALERFESRLATARPEIRARQAILPDLRQSELAEILAGPTEAIVSFAVLEDRVYAFVVREKTPGEAEVAAVRIDLSRQALADRAEDFRSRISDPSRGFGREARELHSLLIEPLLIHLQGVDLLLIVPDGPLWELPFAPLQAPSGRFLIEGFSLAVAPSLTALRESVRSSAQRPAATVPLLVVADPDGSLPATRAEADVLRVVGGERTVVLTGASASEERVKLALAEARVVHIAAHGQVDHTGPLYSHIRLAASPAESQEDGLLEAREVLVMRLAADLVILSSCESGRGDVRPGEGLIGLAWAFQAAGCPTTVVTQWKVESTASSQLMLGFHERLKTMPAHAALRSASLDLLNSNDLRHPFYWAGYRLVGLPRPAAAAR
jgi:CHAT domain-containing protein